MNGKPKNANTDVELDMERRKLELEVRDLSRPWFLRPQYLSAILPAIIGLATVLVLFNRGYFDAREERQRAEDIQLENKRTALTNDIQRMESDREKQIIENTALQKQIQRTRDEAGRLAKLVSDKEAALAAVQKEFAESEITVDLERLVRVMEPNDVLGVQRSVSRSLGSAPTDAGLIAPTLLALRNLIAENDSFSSQRLAIVQRYLESATTPPEMKRALKGILERKE